MLSLNGSLTFTHHNAISLVVHFVEMSRLFLMACLRRFGRLALSCALMYLCLVSRKVVAVCLRYNTLLDGCLKAGMADEGAGWVSVDFSVDV